MNILFLTSTLPRYAGDTQSPFVLEQALAWKKAAPPDNVYVLAPHDAGAKKEENIQGVVIERFQYMYPSSLQKLVYPALLPNIRSNPLLIIVLPFFFISQIVAILRIIRGKKIDVVYAHWFVPQGISAYIALSMFRVYLFMRRALHAGSVAPFSRATSSLATLGSGAGHESLCARHPHKELSDEVVREIKLILHNHSSDVRVLRSIPIIGEALLRRIARASDLIFCVNSNLKQELELFLAKKNTAHSPIVLPMGVSVICTHTQTTVYDFVFIGRFTEKKGLDLFLRALTTLNEHGICPNVAIAGGPQRTKYTELIRRISHAKYVGFVTGEQKSALVKQSRYVVIPSLQVGTDIEGMPVVILESLALGTPVIASTYTNIELLPEWQSITHMVNLIRNPTNISEFVTILDRCLKETVEKPLKLDRYRWENLIKEYIMQIKNLKRKI